MGFPGDTGRLVVTGASGFLGRAFCRAFGADRPLAGLGNTQSPGPGCEPVRLDLTDFPMVRKWAERARPSGVVHLAALSRPDFCQTHPESSELMNFRVPAMLAELCRELGIPFVFTSTDLVFDGTAAPYAETAVPSPVSVYGEHKARAEAAVLAAYPGAAVCRMPIMYGLGGETPSFLDWMLQAAREGWPLRLFTDETRSFASVEDGARGLGLVLDSGQGGMFHLGGPEALTRFELGRLFDRALGGGVVLEPCLRSDVDTPAPRPADVSLESGRAMALGYAPEDAASGLARILKNVSL